MMGLFYLCFRNQTLMKTIIKFIACGFIFLFSYSAFAQQPGLSTQILFPLDTSYIGGVDSVFVKVKNLDTSTYSGYINIYYTTDTATFSPVSLCTLQNVVLLGLDSIQTTCTISFDSTYFNWGNNIVVVWSSGNAKVAADSVWTNVYLDSTGAAVHEKDLSSSFRIYPTITNDFIFIESVEKNILPKKIFIEDVTGRIVKVVSSSFDSQNRIKINTSEFNSGIYFLDILLPNKQRVVSKFVKMD